MPKVAGRPLADGLVGNNSFSMVALNPIPCQEEVPSRTTTSASEVWAKHCPYNDGRTDTEEKRQAYVLPADFKQLGISGAFAQLLAYQAGRTYWG